MFKKINYANELYNKCFISILGQNILEDKQKFIFNGTILYGPRSAKSFDPALVTTVRDT